jgi:hypothetical protein
MTRLYKVQGKVFRLDPEIYFMVKKAGVGRQDIEREYLFMKKITPGLRLVTHSHAAYSAYIKKSKGRSLWDL